MAFAFVYKGGTVRRRSFSFAKREIAMEYKTVKAAASAVFVEKRSRFIADAARVATREDAERFVADIKSKYPDARHHVFAWLLSDGDRRCSDDGEPQGTGGQPVLSILERRGLADTAMVVTRYFGGVLLGAPGLFRAYSAAANMALDSAGISTIKTGIIMKASVDYNLVARVEQLVSRLGGNVTERAFTDKASFTVVFTNGAQKAFADGITELSAGVSCADEVGTGSFEEG
jgi:uncharacterized YigZ family protein